MSGGVQKWGPTTISGTEQTVVVPDIFTVSPGEEE
jgi:hypothetical protein